MRRLALSLTLCSTGCFRYLSGGDEQTGGATPGDGSQSESDGGTERDGPAALLNTAPDGTHYAPTGHFEFACAEGDCQFLCAVDGATPAACESPYDTAPLLPGEHRFEVRAKRDGRIGPAAERRWTVQLPYTLVGRGRPLVVKRKPIGTMEEYVLVDLRCTRVDIAWQGESVYDVDGRDPFQCPIDYSFGATDEPDEFSDGRGTIEHPIYDEREYALRARVYAPTNDPAGWPEGSYVEQVLRVQREPLDGGVDAVDAGPPDAGPEPAEPPPPEGAADGVLVLGRPTAGSTCPADVGINVSGEPTNNAVFTLNMAAYVPPEPNQSTSCALRVPVTVASGWNLAAGGVTIIGDAYGGAMLRLNIEIDGQSLFDARVNPRTTSYVSLPVSLINWDPCPTRQELTVRLDFENLVPNETEQPAIFLDQMELNLVAQGGFGWQTCNR